MFVKLHWHAWRYGLTHPFFVPAELRHVMELPLSNRTGRGLRTADKFTG